MSGELRALEVFDHVPKGCRLHLQPDGAHEPHIHAGEHVIVDPNDLALVQGELYLIGWPSSGTESVRLVTTKWNNTTQCQVANFSPLNRPRSSEELQQWLTEGRELYIGDTGLRVDYLPQYLKGRVRGIFKAIDLSAQRALEARR